MKACTSHDIDFSKLNKNTSTVGSYIVDFVERKTVFLGGNDLSNDHKLTIFMSFSKSIPDIFRFKKLLQ